ncbi:hypothetical protein [Nostoc sp. TCL240-02]|uniref:hypothetical protein n=1 Tax=Nostoc sp. TCL240-02 TaxID=2572090 RepID=UPI00157F8FC7|nr:hypothetical protein [Nostoc sp. TCL240-02]QKQ75627.1 hypothetical protein FBB35_22125 [Nostoc sp. TCL240-02]
MQALHYGAKLHREELHLAELGIATLTSCFVNSSRDPKSEAAKPSDFFYFTPADDEGDRIPPDAANAFFALADAGKLPGWCVALAPVDKLAKSRNSDPCAPVVWVGEGVVLLQPVVDNGLVRFPLGFVEASGDLATSGGVVKVPALGEAWVLDGEMALLG